MLYLKNFGKSFLYTLVSILVLNLILTLFNYIGFIGPKVLSFLKILIPIISLLVGGIVIGRHTTKRAWLEGLRTSSIFVIILLIFNYLIFHNPFLMKHILFYLILMISYIFGSIIGINTRRT